MDNRTVEQIEIVERHITEGWRPRTPGLPNLPSTTINTYTESYELPRNAEAFRGGYDLTGERDVSRDGTFVHNSEGGARIVETHGGGQLDTSTQSRLEMSGGSRPIEETPMRRGISSALRSSSASALAGGKQGGRPVYTVPVAPLAQRESWRSGNLDDSFSRKDSYRAMQTSQDDKGAFVSRTPMQQQSRTSLVSRSQRGEKLGCWGRTKAFFIDVIEAIRNAELTPSLLLHLCCILFLLLLLLILVIVVLSALFNRYSVREFLLFPPVCEECRRKNPALISSALPSSVFVHYYSANQAHFELRGNQPFKSNSFTAVDFTSGYMAIADHALTDASGRHHTCFLLPLDRSALPSMESLMDALDQSSYEIQSQFGWQEFWQFEPEPMDSSLARAKFSDTIRDCAGAKWFLLRQTVSPRDGSCSDCYDFCLPDWAVVRKIKYETESTLGVRRLNCFRLYVPEWREFSIKPDVSGGHWTYPLQSQSTRRDSNGEWANWLPSSMADQVMLTNGA
ncbi:hypothetical protein PRIPAC_92195 [Pristionchus pacificus]|uniref:Uncharacterized protein n=1 Tax=Pristionchus pacificus TaxID=54126 RepID=A0A2A6BJ46_PRIPA|nr:hypothetical protein PRIPAC_92195 [Pristionchus pacificus]|eukprot:PDM65873.1 hypothetical protein PRIPAC_44152 [Pristionchus pacificus]